MARTRTTRRITVLVFINIQVAKSNFRNGGANLPVCRDDPQVVAHHFGNFFWQSLYLWSSICGFPSLSPNSTAHRESPLIESVPISEIRFSYDGPSFSGFESHD